MTFNAGNESRVNTYSSVQPEVPAMARFADGGWLVLWTNWEGDGSAQGISSQIYDDAGEKVGEETQVNTITNNSQYQPSVTVLSDGGWLATWTSYSVDQYYSDVYQQRYDADGNAVGEQTRVNTFTTSYQQDSCVTALADGGWVVSWVSIYQDYYGQSVYQQRYDANGNTVGDETWLTGYDQGDSYAVSVAGLASGGWVASWTATGQDGSGAGIFQQVYDADGNKYGRQTTVNSTTAGDQEKSSVAALESGGWVVAWTGNGTGNDIFMQAYDANGGKVGGETLVNSYRTADQDEVSIAGLGGGGWVVVWTSNGQDGSGDGIYMQLYDADGDKIGDETRVNATTSQAQNTPTVTALSDGGWVVGWQDASAQSYSMVKQREFHYALTARDATLTTDEDKAITLSAGDFGYSDTDGDFFASVMVTAPPTKGMLMLQGATVAEGQMISVGDIDAGKLVWAPPVNASGNDLAAFGFRVGDDTGEISALAYSLTLDVAAVNDAPAALDDVAALTEGKTVKVKPLANDTDQEGDPLSLTQAKISSGKGSVSVDGGHLVVSYTGKDLDPGQQATIKITYTMTDGQATDEGKVTVTVTGVAEPGDDIKGTGEADTMTGTSSGEKIYGYDGGDTIKGQGGADKILGGTGNDHLWGGNGKDVFAFSGQFGKDVVEDFTLSGSNADKIDLSDISKIESWADLRDNHLVMKNGDATIVVGDDLRITLDGIDKSDLKSGMFVI